MIFLETILALTSHCTHFKEVDRLTRQLKAKIPVLDAKQPKLTVERGPIDADLAAAMLKIPVHAMETLAETGNDNPTGELHRPFFYFIFPALSYFKRGSYVVLKCCPPPIKISFLNPSHDHTSYQQQNLLQCL
jgi:hypothetical protein